MKELDILSELQGKEVVLQAAIDLAEMGVWSFDISSQQATLSERMQRWYNLPYNTTYAEIQKTIAPEFRTKAAKSFKALLNDCSGKNYDIIYDIIDSNIGNRRTLHVLGKCVFNAEGQAVSISGTARDITVERNINLALEYQVQLKTEELASFNEELRASVEQLGVANAELEVINQDLQVSNAELTQFAYVASHDLQEPLRKIRLYSSMLAGNENLRDQELDLLQKIESSAGKMKQLITDLLEYSTAIRSFDADLVAADLNVMIANVLSDFEVTILEKRAKVTISDLPEIQCMPVQIAQLFSNLLGNALKFSSKSATPRILISSEKMPYQELSHIIPRWKSTTQYHRISVVDNGIGLDMEFASYIFDVFKRLHSKRDYPGSGIGLALCRKIVTNHKGAIYVESVVNQGTTFHIVLPERQD